MIISLAPHLFAGIDSDSFLPEENSMDIEGEHHDGPVNDLRDAGRLNVIGELERNPVAIDGASYNTIGDYYLLESFKTPTTFATQSHVMAEWIR